MDRKIKKGFTLIELLVVIAIIAILAAMLLPALAQARMKTEEAVDMANLKEIGLGALMYEQDYRRFPPCAGYISGTNQFVLWPVFLFPYTLGIPANVPSFDAQWQSAALNYQRHQSIFVDPSGYNTISGVSDYGIDGTAEYYTPTFPGNGITCEAYSQIMHPSQTMMFGDSAGSDMYGYRLATWWAWDKNSVYSEDELAAGADRHSLNSGNLNGAMINFVFVDGHASAIPFMNVPVPDSTWESAPNSHGVNGPQEWGFTAPIDLYFWGIGF